MTTIATFFSAREFIAETNHAFLQLLQIFVVFKRCVRQIVVPIPSATPTFHKVFENVRNFEICHGSGFPGISCHSYFPSCPTTRETSPSASPANHAPASI